MMGWFRESHATTFQSTRFRLKSSVFGCSLLFGSTKLAPRSTACLYSRANTVHNSLHYTMYYNVSYAT